MFNLLANVEAILYGGRIQNVSMKTISYFAMNKYFYSGVAKGYQLPPGVVGKGGVKMLKK